MEKVVTHLISNFLITQLVDMILLFPIFKMLDLTFEIVQLTQYFSFWLLTMQIIFVSFKIQIVEETAALVLPYLVKRSITVLRLTLRAI